MCQCGVPKIVRVVSYGTDILKLSLNLSWLLPVISSFQYYNKYLALTVHWLWATEELPSQVWSKLAHLDIVDKKTSNIETKQ